MRVVCPSCDRESAAGAHAGSACAGCGAKLVQIVADADLDDKLELEPEWQREKQAKQEAANAPRPRAPMRRGSIVVALVVLAAAGTGIWYTTRPRTAPPQQPGPTLPATPNTVSLDIHAPSDARITVDGVFVGTGALHYNVARSRRAVFVEMSLDGRTLARQVVPDRDQLVDLGP